MALSRTSKRLFLPAQIQEMYTWMDGGSVQLLCRNSLGEKLEIKLVQHVFFDAEEIQDEWIPGRLYLNEKLVEVGSPLEKQIIEFLGKVELIEGLSEEERAIDEGIIEEMLVYLKSEKAP